MTTRTTIVIIIATAAYALLTLGIVKVFDHDETAADYLPTPTVQCDELH